MNDTKTGEQAPAMVVRAPVWQDGARKAQLLDALRLGKPQGVVDAFMGGEGSAATPQTLDMARYLIESRRQNVAMVGTNDVFVRRTDGGELRQVVAPVSLSLLDGTLYQLPIRREKRLRDDPTKVWHWKQDKGQAYVWRDVYKDEQQATVSAEGYLRMNAVAGCSVQLPPTVMLDGVPASNPHIGRDEHGDITRIVISVYVAGPAPLTGNLVVVQYVLDLDPRSDLLHMLSTIMKGKVWKEEASDDDDAMDQDGGSKAVELMAANDFNEFRAEMEPRDRRRWHWVRLHGPVGLAHDMGNAAVRAAYDKYLGIGDNAVKKAQTVARRNAMKAHPALARHTVNLNGGSTVVVAVTGWTSNGADLDRYTRALDALARGQATPNVEVLSYRDSYDPTQDATGEAELDVGEVVDDEVMPATGAVLVTDDMAERNDLVRQLDELVCADAFTPARVTALGYPPPPGATVDELRSMVDRAERHIQGSTNAGR